MEFVAVVMMKVVNTVELMPEWKFEEENGELMEY